jgi:hypothetical protein
MTVELSPKLLEAYSRGEISRREIGERQKEDVSFGDLFSALLERGLPLPRFPGHPDSPGVRLIKQLAQRAPYVG